LLDFTSSDDTLGKAVGVDLLGGKVTLPLIYLMAADSSGRDLVDAVMTDGNYERVERPRLLAALERVGALDRARARADEYAEAAGRGLAGLPASDYSQALQSIPTYVLDRDR
jgi:octaprenyl-diphosphate synthase